MVNKLSSFFRLMDASNPSSELERWILARIRREIEGRAKRRRFFSWIGFGFSSVTAAIAVVYAGGVLVQSDFWSLLSLMFTDAGVVFSDWRNFGLSLLDTLPAVSLSLMLIPMAALFFSLWFYKSSKLDISRQNWRFPLRA